MNIAEKIIEKCGGIRHLASILNKQASTVQGWKRRGYIPARLQNDVLNTALKHGLKLTPEDFFNLETEEDSVPIKTKKGSL